MTQEFEDFEQKFGQRTQEIIRQGADRLKNHIAQVFDQYRVRKTTDLYLSDDFISGSEEEKEKLIDNLTKDFEVFYNELVRSVRHESTERVKNEFKIYESKSKKLKEKVQLLQSMIESFIKIKDFVKVRQLVFNFKKQFIKEIKKLEKEKNLQIDDLYYDDIYKTLKNVKDEFKIDHFWTRIKR